MKKEYDVIIVGSRVAGSSLAILLGRIGKRVLLVDKDRFPSHTLSTHHIGSMEYLERLGVLEDLLASGLRLLTRTRIYVENCLVEGPAQDYAIAPDRYLLDQTLLTHALRYPTVEFRERTRVEGLLTVNGRVTGVTLRSSNGTVEELYAGAVVGADGRNSNVAEWVEAERYEEVPPLRAGYYGYFEGVEPLPEPATELFFQAGRIGFVFPMEPSRDCLAMEIPVEEFEQFRKNPEAEFEQRFREFYGMERRLRNARLNGKVFGARGIANYLRKPYGAGWALTGDAAYCKDPVSGLGINDAFLQSFLLAEAFEAIDNGKDWESAMARYQQQRDLMVLPAYRITHQIAQFQQPSKQDTALLKALFSHPALPIHWLPKLPSLLLQGILLPPELMGFATMSAIAIRQKEGEWR
jgi:2-polyprenyl-6-methoxyphenol hydroxylase-like FAD-dependent oxidoreductase